MTAASIAFRPAVTVHPSLRGGDPAKAKAETPASPEPKAPVTLPADSIAHMTKQDLETLIGGKVEEAQKPGSGMIALHSINAVLTAGMIGSMIWMGVTMARAKNAAAKTEDEAK